MSKKIVIVSAVALVGLVGIYFASIQEGSIEASPHVGTDRQSETTEGQLGVSAPVSQDSIDEEAVTETVVLSAEDISVLQARSKQVSSELDALTKELDSELENPEKRKSIQAQYQQLADEQNLLAIQLVKLNQSQMAEE